MCSASVLWSQLVHAAFLALCMVLLGAIALALDLAADRALRWGADRTTYWVLKLASLLLLAMDMAVLLAVAVTQAFPVIGCLTFYL